MLTIINLLGKQLYLTTSFLTKENARIKEQLLKETAYQESIISKTFKRISNNHSLYQSQQQMQATDIQEDEIKMSMN